MLARLDLYAGVPARLEQGSGMQERRERSDLVEHRDAAALPRP